LDAAQIQSVFQVLEAKGFAVAPGLDVDEHDAMRERFGVAFPDDLRAFLAVGDPLDHEHGRFPDWRRGGDAIRDRVAWPVESVCLDVEKNEFW
jgi:hypothetical protein